jgi:hypothetical protein
MTRPTTARAGADFIGVRVPKKFVSEVLTAAVGTLFLVVFIELLGVGILVPVIPMPNLSAPTSSSGAC